MTSSVTAFLAVICIMAAVFSFFKITYNVVLNSFFRKFWYQAEKCFINFELMFLDERFSLTKCRLIIVASTIASTVLAGYACKTAPSMIPYVAMGIGAVAGWVLPGIVTSYLHKKYVEKFDSQFLDCLGMLSSGLRSGLSLQQSMELVSTEMPQPVSQEFSLVLSEYRYGKTVDEALERLAKRIPSVDLGITIEAVLILRSTGANLIETFDIIIDTVRERKRVEGKIKSLTAMGVLQGFILGAMPFVLMWVLGKVNPTYMDPFFNTTIGWVMFGIVILLVGLGGLAIKSIVTIDV